MKLRTLAALVLLATVAAAVTSWRLRTPAYTRPAAEAGTWHPICAPSVTLRIALHAEGDLRNRVIRVLQTERGAEIVLLGGDPDHDSQESPPPVETWDLLAVGAVTAATRPMVEQASARGLPVVVAADLPVHFPTADATFVSGAARGSGLAAALATSMLPRDAQALETRLAWTVAGRPLRAGRPITFPEPVGPLWAGWAENPIPWPDVACFGAPTDSRWQAVRVDLRFQAAAGEETLLVHGVSDQRGFLDAACFGAAIRAAARGAYPAGAKSGPGDPDGVFIRLAQDAGVLVARFATA